MIQNGKWEIISSNNQTMEVEIIFPGIFSRGGEILERERECRNI